MPPLSHFLPRNLLSWPTSRFLGVTGVLAAFVLVAHGGALFGDAQQGHPHAEEIRSLAQISVPLSALVVVGSLFAWLRPSAAAVVLRGQALAGLALALYLVLWAAQLLLGGELPLHFLWTPGFLTAIVYYAAVLFVAHLVGNRVSNESRHTIPVFAAVVTAVLDLGVLIKALQ